MTNIRVVLSMIVMVEVSSSKAKAVSNIAQPQFAFIEDGDLQVKYSDSYEKDGLNRSLYLCCDPMNKTSIERFSVWLCGDFVQKCPHYLKVPDSYYRSHGHVKVCEMTYVCPDVQFWGYVAATDLKNSAFTTSKVATYVTNQDSIQPRPVEDFAVAPWNSNLNLTWRTSNKYDITSSYSTLVYCRPTEKRNAKAIRATVDFFQTSFVVPSINITAVTKYQCCVHVENVLTSVTSEVTCKNVQSPEQGASLSFAAAPSSAPEFLCGNQTATCPYVVYGQLRNVTLFFKLPDVDDRNGEIVRHMVIYQEDGSANFTTLEVNNGSATRVSLNGLRTNSSVLTYIRSCTKAGCSPLSRPVLINKIQDVINDYDSKRKVLSIVIGVVGGVAFVVVIIIAYLLWHKRNLRMESLWRLVLKPIDSLEYQTASNPNLRDENYDNPYVLPTDDGEISVQSNKTLW